MYLARSDNSFYIKIADVVIKINCPRNLFLYDDWENFFTKKLEPFVVPRQKHKILVRFSGIKIRGLKTIPETVSANITMPIIQKNVIVIDNSLHPSLFLYTLSKLLIRELNKANKLILHSSGVVYKGSALLFVGNSGEGKSTAHNKLTPPCLSLGDDSIIVGLKKSRVVAYPTPLNTKVVEEYAPNKGYPISKIFFLKKSDKLALEKMERLNAATSISSQFKHPINNRSTARLALKISSMLSGKTHTLFSGRSSSLTSYLVK